MIIPEKLKNKAFRFVLLGESDKFKKGALIEKRYPKTKIELRAMEADGWKPLGKAPFEQVWQKVNNYPFDSIKLENHILFKNYGVLTGFGNLRVLDIDNPIHIDYFEKKFNTFTIKTGSGGRHFYFLSDYDINHVLKDGIGELRCQNECVVAPSCIHPIGQPYEIIHDKELQVLTIKEVKDIISAYFRPEIDSSESPIDGKTDESRSGLEFRRVIALIKSGKNKEEIFKLMMSYSKWCSGHPAYREATYNKAKTYVDSHQEPDIQKFMNIKTFNDYKHLKKERGFLVNGMIYPKTNNLLYSPPAQFKSLLSLNMAIAIATGKEFLRLKTKKQAVLYCDGENNDQIIKDRLLALHKGMLLKRNKFPLYILKSCNLINEKKQVNDIVLGFLEDFIEEKKIKVVFFDTLHRFAFYDENKADDLNLLYMKVFQPLIEKYGVAIIFLHHTTKQGNYRGSSDLMGQVDTAYYVNREFKTGKFSFVNEKCRSGEIPTIMGEIDFGEDYIKINRLNEVQEDKKKLDKLKEITQKIREFINKKGELELFKKKDILDNFDIIGFDYSIRTVIRSLNWLVDNKYIDRDEKGNYRRILE